MRPVDLRRLLLMRVVPALFGALLGLAATSPEAVIEIKNLVAWLGAQIVSTSFPDLVL